MKKYAYRLQREVSYVEDVEAIIVARNSAEAERIAGELGNGEGPNWPAIERYGITRQSPIRHELIELEYVPDG